MKISIISDTHLGFGYGTEREDDAFLAFEEAVNKSLGVDMIILAGDIFDSRNPNTEALTRAMEILRKPLEKDNGTRIINYIKRNNSITPPLNAGIPVVAIHGTHERRPKGLVNPIEAMERAGFLTHLHCNGVAIEKKSTGEKVSIQGISGIPDQYATIVLAEWNPKPEAGYLNIFLSHQSIAPFLYATHLVPLENLPKGFDLYINGHIHSPKKTTYSGSPFIIPGSIVITQVTKDNTLGGFCIVETCGNKIKSADWPAMDNRRKAYYMEENEAVDLKQKIEEILSENHKLKPIIKIVSKSDAEAKALQKEFSEKAIIFCKRQDTDDEFESKSITEQMESVQNLGKKLLEKNMALAGLDPKIAELLFDLLLEKKYGKAADALKNIVK